MFRRMPLAAMLMLLSVNIALGQGTAPTSTPAPGTARPANAEIYRAARSALAEARNRASSRDLSTRKQALAALTASARKSVASRFGISLEQLDRIIEEGERADGTAARKATSSAKVAAKANVQGQLVEVDAAMTRAMTTPAAGSGLGRFSNLRPSDAAMVSHYLSGNPNYLPDAPASRTLHTGPRGGVYTITPQGTKVYEKK